MEFTSQKVKKKMAELKDQASKSGQSAALHFVVEQG